MFQVINHGPTGKDEEVIATVGTIREAQSITQEWHFNRPECWTSIRNIGEAPRAGEVEA
jgi:hypothetical protein